MRPTPARVTKRSSDPNSRCRIHEGAAASCEPSEAARGRVGRAQVPPARWQRYQLLEGSKGPLVAEFVAVRAVAHRDRPHGPEGWLLVRGTVPAADEAPAYKYYRSNAPAETPLGELVHVSGMRWPVEACFTECGQELGLDDYEVRAPGGGGTTTPPSSCWPTIPWSGCNGGSTRERGLASRSRYRCPRTRRTRWPTGKPAPRRHRSGCAWPRCACCCAPCCRCRRSTPRQRWPGWPISSAASWPPAAPTAGGACAGSPDVAHEFSRCTTGPLC